MDNVSFETGSYMYIWAYQKYWCSIYCIISTWHY